VLKVPWNFDFEKFEERCRDGGVLKDISKQNIRDRKGQTKFLLIIMDVQGEEQIEFHPVVHNHKPISFEIFEHEPGQT